MIKELVVISGKGGTGKTSLLASFAVLAKGTVVVADADVDAADLHLVLSPVVQRRELFRSGHEAVIRQEDCTQCGACLRHCRFSAVRMAVIDGKTRVSIDPAACEGCGVCVHFCPAKAIDFRERLCGEWYLSETRFGPMVHARLGIAAENSGKLVSLVRREARLLAEERGLSWILVDGPPGIGCPVIASMTGATAALIVTEPTLSGAHDLRRVLELTRHFGLRTLVAVNKWDINPEQTEKIEREAIEQGAVIGGRIPYDRLVTAAQVNAKPLLEYGEGPASRSIRQLWENVCQKMQ